MTFEDARGQTLSTEHAASAAAYDQTLDLLLSFRPDPVAVIVPVLAQDPDFISGHLLLAGMMLSTFDPQMQAPARASLDAALASRLQPTGREQSLQQALRLWADGDLQAGNRAFDRHLVDHPRDLLALQLAHGGDLMLGRSTMLRDRIARVQPQWTAHDSGYGYLLGMQAFGLEECFAYAQAEEVGRLAVALQPHDVWAVHAVAHVCQMQGRVADGKRWLKQTEAAWAQNNGLSVHNHWHLALMQLAEGDTAAVLARYDQAVAPQPESLALNLSDASALLWRLNLQGVDVGGRWSALAQRWAQHLMPGSASFYDLHAALSFAAAGDHHNSERLALAMAQAAARPGARAEWALVAAPACQAIQAMVDGQYARCAALLLPLLPISQLIGGSHAQRELLLLTAQVAARRSGDTALAAALQAQAQVHQHPALALRHSVAPRADVPAQARAPALV